MSAAGDDRPIFIVACPRSGTTLLQLMLHSHPRIAIPPETRFVLPAYVHRLEFGDLEQRENRKRVARFVTKRGTRFGDLGLDRRAVRRQIAAAPPTLGSLLGTVFRAYADRHDRPRWGDKRPGYHAYLEILLRLFPNAQVVHLIRDPRACVASLKRVPWWKHGIEHSISAWAQSIDDTDRAIRRWPGIVTRVSYERLVADPEAELRTLAAALGEDYDARMAEPDRLASEAVPKRKHWHEQTRTAPSTESIGRWTSELELVGGRALRARARRADGALRLRADRARPRPGPRRLLRHAYVHRTRTAARRFRLAVDRLKRRREPNPVAARFP